MGHKPIISLNDILTYQKVSGRNVNTVQTFCKRCDELLYFKRLGRYFTLREGVTDNEENKNYESMDG